ncbi:hypothetical protein [Halarchaeum salinum]
MVDLSRRRFLGVAAGATIAAGTAGTASAMRIGTGREWQPVSSPTDRTLHDVALADGTAYAVGGGGVVLERTDEGWRTLIANGPHDDGSNLHAAAGDGDGRVWIAGASGALAVLDAATGTVTSHRSPDDVTNQFTDIEVAGTGDDATVYVTDSSGHVHASSGRNDRRDWTHVTPGSGAAIRAVSCRNGRTVVVDTNTDVFETHDGGATWHRFGIDDADAGFRDVTLAGNSAHIVGGALYSETGGGWDVADPCEATLYDVEIGSCGCVHAVGADGTILHRPGRGIPYGATLAKWLGRWDTTNPVSETLHGFVLGPPHVAVGASGTIIER